MVNPKGFCPGCLLFLVVLLSSCERIQKSAPVDDEGEKVARVYESFLYESDLRDVVPEELGKKDSASFVQNYIQVWAQDQLMIYKAEFNLTESEKNFEEQINKYRNDLLKFTYQQKYINSRLDTTIAREEIREYYREHSNEFLLKQDVFQIYYVSVSKEAPKLSQAKRWFKSGSEADQQKLEDFALKYAQRFNLSDTSWVDFDYIKKLIPFADLTKDKLVNFPEHKFLEEPNRIYMIRKLDYRKKGAKAPLTYVSDVIRNILVNRKRLELLDELENNLINDAIENKQFETF